MTGRGSAFRRTNPELFRCSWCLVTGRAYAKTENRWPRITQWHLHQIEFRFRPVMYHIWLECCHVTNHSQRCRLTVGIGGFPIWRQLYHLFKSQFACKFEYLPDFPIGILGFVGYFEGSDGRIPLTGRKSAQRQSFWKWAELIANVRCQFTLVLLYGQN